MSNVGSEFAASGHRNCSASVDTLVREEPDDEEDEDEEDEDNEDEGDSDGYSE
jgi:hypothetical protein